MIKLFRNIRRNLLAEGKTSRYLKYAIGEIILVVIGILIALQINNWNEDRKVVKIELKLLEEVKTNLEATLANFISDTIYNSKTIAYYRDINYYIQNDLPYSKNLDSAFAAIPLFSSPYTINTGYKTLQTKGLDLIKNVDLKFKIVRMYDVESISLLVDVDKAEWSINENVVLPFFSKYINTLDTNSLNLSRPIDFENLKHNHEFTNILNMLIRSRRKSMIYYRATMVSIKELITAIETELRKRK